MGHAALQFFDPLLFLDLPKNEHSGMYRR